MSFLYKLFGIPRTLDDLIAEAKREEGKINLELIGYTSYNERKKEDYFLYATIIGKRASVLVGQGSHVYTYIFTKDNALINYLYSLRVEREMVRKALSVVEQLGKEKIEARIENESPDFTRSVIVDYNVEIYELEQALGLKSNVQPLYTLREDKE